MPFSEYVKIKSFKYYFYLSGIFISFYSKILPLKFFQKDFRLFLFRSYIHEKRKNLAIKSTLILMHIAEKPMGRDVCKFYQYK